MELIYEAIDMDQLEIDMNACLVSIHQDAVEEKISALYRFHKLRDHYLTMYWTSYIQYICDYKNETWIASEALFGASEVRMKKLLHKYFETLLEYQSEPWLIDIINKHTLQIARVETKLFCDEIGEDLLREQEQVRKYLSKIRTTKTEFQGSSYNLASLSKFLLSNDSKTRKGAMDARIQIFEQIGETSEEVLSELIVIRNRIASKLGYSSYTVLSYDKMYRFDYHEEEIQAFRDAVKQYILPLVLELKEMQRENVGAERLHYYDHAVHFSDGVSTPKGDVFEIVTQAEKMYQKLDPRLGNLFSKLKQEHCMDLEAREGKANSGVATYLPEKGLPIFIASFHKINHDINVITHEFGHATQLYESRHLNFHENRWPSYDVCEIPSTTMEYLCWEELDRFFETKKDADKYRFDQLIVTLELILYACLVDHFQHVIYQRPELSKNERNELWHQLEREYQPYLDPEENEYLTKGPGYQKQSQIFDAPFYYIDYALSSIVAIQFFVSFLENQTVTMDRYFELCKKGGSVSFVTLLKELHLASPFEAETIAHTAEVMKQKIRELKQTILR